jgi:chemotaxis protein methyltransferase CheR
MSTSLARSEETGHLSPAQFARIAEIARREAGLALSAAKTSMISARIARRLRDTGKRDFAAYVAYLESGAGADELRMLISALTTNVTSFFREDHHFRLLESETLERLAIEAKAGRPVRLWSAGCATGQEPYSIAITILRRFPEALAHDVRILATDIDEAALGRAIRGRYTRAQLEAVPPADRRRFFEERDGGEMEAGADLRKLITFRPLNLVGAWPLQKPFDVIFCRNVVIYFDSQTQGTLWPRFHRALSPEGLLFIGHSERLDPGSAQKFSPVGATSYRKSPESKSWAGGARPWH